MIANNYLTCNNIRRGDTRIIFDRCPPSLQRHYDALHARLSFRALRDFPYTGTTRHPLHCDHYGSGSVCKTILSGWIIVWIRQVRQHLVTNTVHPSPRQTTRSSEVNHTSDLLLHAS